MHNILILDIKTFTLITLNKTLFINLKVIFLLHNSILTITTFNITAHKSQLLKVIKKRILYENETTTTLKT